ncbi:MAG: hypothetical protein F9K22_15020, partial [Bacteroidetes bacterium]
MQTRHRIRTLAVAAFFLCVQWLYPQLSNNPSASGVLGQTDYVTKTTGNGATKLNGPNGISVDASTGK